MQTYPMIRINNVSKQYTLGAIGGTTLRDELQRKMAKLKRRDDPTRIIGKENQKKKLGKSFGH